MNYFIYFEAMTTTRSSMCTEQHNTVISIPEIIENVEDLNLIEKRIEKECSNKNIKLQKVKIINISKL